jgi:hypothetical protein
MNDGPYQDPGWFNRSARTGSGVGLDGLTVFRFLFFSLSLAPLLILFVLIFIFEEVGSPEGGPAAGIVGLGCLGIGLAKWASNRKLDTTDAAALANSYRSNFFLGFTLNEMMLLIAFGLSFVGGEMWPYLVALPFFYLGMAVLAPSRRHLERKQEQLYEQGSGLNLSVSLARPTT